MARSVQEEALMKMDLALLLADLSNPAPAAPAEVAAQWSKIMGLAKWAAFAAGAVGLVVAGVMMSLGRRHRSTAAADGAAGIGWAVAGLSTVAVAVPLVNLFM
jgi:hypothetical protein